MTDWPTCTRPDGREYRPTKPPAAIALLVASAVDQIVVVRTHDLDLARDLATAEMTSRGLVGWAFGYTATCWGKWRATGHDHTPGWRDEPSNPKATPAVFFDVVWPS